MKLRRDITLGEMQDECKKHENYPCDGCPYQSWCGGCSPDGWDLTDPPRFTEAQMALLEALWINGALTICTCEGSIMVRDKFVHQLLFADMIGMKENDYINLAELFGKEEGEKNQ